MKVSSIRAQCVIIKLHYRVILKDMKNQFMMVLGILAQYVIIKRLIKVILKGMKNQPYILSYIPEK